ncbi:major facilitator superfamily domain-containing protein [Delphinella strobiligena]|nr:major facilitator superfamily domain-containing protein [Delphinella strobiligena]
MVMSGKQRQERRLPVQQMLVLGASDLLISALARFGEPVAFTSIFPYLPEMIESLDVPKDQVAKWAGIAASMFPLAQTVTAVAWGRASDKYGRKPIILLGLTSTMITSLLWGFSRSITMAIVVRALAGAGNGNVGIIRTAVAEMVPWKELQPRAFSIMPLVWNIGSIFGPTLGGALANPEGIKPGQPLPANPSFLEKFPYALPNIIASLIFVVGIITGMLFLEETLAVKCDQRDYALLLGDKIKYVAKSSARRIKKIFTGQKDEQDLEREPLLKQSSSAALLSVDEEVGLDTKPRETPPPPSIREVLHEQSILNLIVYTLLALHNIAFDQLIPIFMHYPVQDHSSSNPDFMPPFKFSGGFGLDTRRIGFLFTLYGVSGMLVQFFIFPPIARKYGVLRCLRVCVVTMPLIYFFVPFTALLPDQTSQQFAIFGFMIMKGFTTTFAFPSATILLTNSASSLRILGMLNGLATSAGAVGRAAGPAIGGFVFTIGVQRGFMIAPWWLLSAIALVAAIPTFWLVEGEGFGGHDDNVDDDDDFSAQPPTLKGTATLGNAEHEQEEGYDGVGPLLSKTNTNASEIVPDEDEEGYASDDATRRRSSGPLRRKVSRKLSTPIGMNKPIGLRYSSSLGQSLGSAGSYNG